MFLSKILVKYSSEVNKMKIISTNSRLNNLRPKLDSIELD